jgi:hypothetical protein
MMDSANIQRAAVLYQEMQQIDLAVKVIDADGTITAVTLTSATLGNVFVAIPTEGLQYPPQMIAAIKAQLEERRSAINYELAELGVGPIHEVR